MNSSHPGDRLCQRRPFHRPLFDADLCGRRHRHGARARHGLFRTVALRDAGLRRFRRGLAADRLARRPLEPPPHDGDLLCRHRRLDDSSRPRQDAARTRRGAVVDRPVRLDLSPCRHRDDRLLCRGARPRRWASTACGATSAWRRRRWSPAWSANISAGAGPSSCRASSRS